MALWLGADGVGLCAAFNEPRLGDRYIDDAEHYRLWEQGELTTEDDGDTWRLGRTTNERNDQ